MRQIEDTKNFKGDRKKKGKGEKQNEGKEEEKEKNKRNGDIHQKFTKKEQEKKCGII